MCVSTDVFLFYLFLFDFFQESQARVSPIPFTSSADTSILPIVTSQRDRFRQRNAELEEVSPPPPFPRYAGSLLRQLLYRNFGGSSRLSRTCARR